MQGDSREHSLGGAAAEPPAIGSDELAEGLMLVRASTIKMIRLQLAMERHDRRVALEAVDDLVELDRRLKDYLADVSGSLQGEKLFCQMESERAALEHEKLLLAAGVVRREPAEPVEEVASPVELDPAPPTFEYRAKRENAWGRRAAWLGAILMLASAIAVAAALLGLAGLLKSLLAGVGG